MAIAGNDLILYSPTLFTRNIVATRTLLHSVRISRTDIHLIIIM